MREKGKENMMIFLTPIRERRSDKKQIKKKDKDFPAMTQHMKI